SSARIGMPLKAANSNAAHTSSTRSLFLSDTVSSLAAPQPHRECRPDDGSNYRELLAGGARRRTSERSATGCSWQRTAVRLRTVITTAGITTHSGVRTTAPKVDAAAGANAAKTTTARQRITTVFLVRGL